jgi:hypothetical protein
MPAPALSPLPHRPCHSDHQGAVQQFVGASGPTARPSDGLKTWQRTVLADMGLLGSGGGGGSSSSGAASESSSSGTEASSSSTSGGGAQTQGAKESARAAEAEGPTPDRPAAAAAAAAAAGATAAPVVVSIGGDPPVSGPLLAACRVMLSEVGVARRRGMGVAAPACL